MSKGFNRNKRNYLYRRRLGWLFDWFAQNSSGIGFQAVTTVKNSAGTSYNWELPVLDSDGNSFTIDL